MTVVDVEKYGFGSGEISAKCQWFAGERMDDLKEDIFELEAIEKVKN